MRPDTSAIVTGIVDAPGAALNLSYEKMGVDARRPKRITDGYWNDAMVKVAQAVKEKFGEVAAQLPHGTGQGCDGRHVPQRVVL